MDVRARCEWVTGTTGAACWGYKSSDAVHYKLDGTPFSGAEVNPGTGPLQPRKADFTILDNLAPGGTPNPAFRIGDIACMYALLTFTAATDLDIGTFAHCASRCQNCVRVPGARVAVARYCHCQNVVRGPCVHRAVS